MSAFVIFILSFIEGLTEFLPISSTGHLILTSAALSLNDDAFVQNFNIIIQFGAILSVLVLYKHRFFPIRPAFYQKLFVSFLPAALIGFLLKSKIETLLGNVTVVAWALIVGGVLLIVFDRRAERKAGALNIEDLNCRQSLLIGFAQCFALVPGVSRSGAAILGALGLGLSREAATEYSFFLAVPTLVAAGLFKAYKALPTLQADQISSLALGTFLSFAFALLAIRFFIRLVGRYGLQHFGYYRIILGVAILALLWGGQL